MTRREIIRRALATGLIYLISVVGGPAAPISWGAPQVIVGDADVKTNGLYLEARCYGSATTLNGVSFNTWTGDKSGLSGPYSGFATNAGSLSSAYKAVIGSGLWGSASPSTLTLSSLYVGQTYQIQIWVSDSRSTGAARNETVTGSPSAVLDYNDTEATGGLGHYGF